MKCSKYRFITQITVATILGLSLEALSTTNAKAAQIDVPAVLIQQKDFEQKGQDPLLMASMFLMVTRMVVIRISTPATHHRSGRAPIIWIRMRVGLTTCKQ